MIAVRELSAPDRAALVAHLVQLDGPDRRLRFGSLLNDAALRAYAERIDFERDAAFGVFGEELQLIGAAHVARADGHAELGVSVLLPYRGRGIGSALLARAHTRARNWGLGALFMHCLAENSAMMRLAQKQGMRIVLESGEADAWLELAPADASSYFGEVFEQRVALFDYALKRQVDVARRIAAALIPGTRSPAPEK